MSVCKNCGQEIDWVRKEDGRYIPVDPEPVFVIEGEGSERFYDEELGEITGKCGPWRKKSIRRSGSCHIGEPARAGGRDKYDCLVFGYPAVHSGRNTVPRADKSVGRAA